jgi:[ribosomal protein S5]-alanine N-acetyltransferase
MSQPFDFSHFPTLDTDRLRLREMTPQDVTALLKHLGNPEVVKYMDMQPIKTREQANEWLRWMGSYFSAHDGLRWGVTLKADNTFIGSAGIGNWNREARYAEIGYDIAQPYWDNGYATEVSRAIIEFGINRMNLNRIEADIVAGNDASMRVLEKLGFQQEGILRERVYKDEKYYDVHLFGILKKDL